MFSKVNDIMTEHMAEIIINSHADFLVVIGDRNMKNKSVHSKRKGKLIEMKVLPDSILQVELQVDSSVSWNVDP